MIREWSFLAAESTMISAVILGSWLMVAHALGKMGVRVTVRPTIVGLSIWLIVSGCNVVLTGKWGPSFTALYHVAGWACLGSLVLYCISLGLATAADDKDIRR